MTDIERGLLLAEDEALKAKLSNITVAAPRSSGGGGVLPGRKRVKTWFRMPETEKERDYPYITISLVDIVFAADRAHSAQIAPIDYWPSEYATFAEYAAANDIPYDAANQYAEAVWWHPYNLFYEVTTHARTAQHDREITARLMQTSMLPDRWGYLQVPADGSERHLVREGWSQADFYEGVGADSKRVFRKVYSISVTADMPPENPFLYYKVLQVAGTLSETESDLSDTWTNT